jgi:hypothetical protein
MTDVEQPVETDLSTITDGAAEFSLESANAIETIHSNLDALTRETDGYKRLDLAVNTWEWCQYIVKLTENSTALTGTAAQIAATALEQRNDALHKLQALTEAVEWADENHPLVASLKESLEESIQDDMYYDMQEQQTEAYDEGFAEGINAAGDDKPSSEDIYDSLYEGIAATCKIDYMDAVELVNGLSGEDTLTESLLDTLIGIFEQMKAALP